MAKLITPDDPHVQAALRANQAQKNKEQYIDGLFHSTASILYSQLLAVQYKHALDRSEKELSTRLANGEEAPEVQFNVNMGQPAQLALQGAQILLQGLGLIVPPPPEEANGDGG